MRLDEALWAYRTAFKTLIRTTPFNLIYGKACHHPLELEHKVLWALKKLNFDYNEASKNRLIQLEELENMRQFPYESSKIYKEKT